MGLLSSVVWPMAVAVGCAPLALPQSETPRRLVRLNVAATNARGEPVTDLQPADLQVREDGKPRPIVFFRFAGNRRSSQAPGPREFVNSPVLTPTVILLDRWNQKGNSASGAWLSLGNVLEHMESVDRIFIYFLTNNGDLFPVRPLPATDADLRATPNPSPAELRAELDEAVRKVQGLRHVNAQDLTLRANKTLQAIDALGTQMASLAGRKNLIWVTQGVPLVAPIGADQMDLTPQVLSLSTGAGESQIAIYTVDESMVGGDVGGDARLTLQMFSALTGGRWYPSDYAGRAIADSIADGRGNYRVAYYSPLREKDHKEHKIRVDSVRKGIRVLTREGYAGDAIQFAPQAMEDAVFASERRSPFDASEIGLRVKVSRTTVRETMRFNIRVNPEDVLLEHSGEKYQGRLGVMLAFYSDGFLKRAPTPTHVNIALTQEQFDKALTDGIEVPEDAPVDDNIQKIRVMVFDHGLRGLGSVTFPTPE